MRIYCFPGGGGGVCGASAHVYLLQSTELFAAFAVETFVNGWECLGYIHYVPTAGGRFAFLVAPPPP
jgi:hypothetical protein